MLVENRPSFNVVLTPPEHGRDLDETVARVARVLRVGEGQIRERLARRAPPFKLVVLRTDASLRDVAAVEARRRELPEVSVEVVPLRSYPLASAAAHTLGRVGEVTERQMLLPEFSGLEPGALVGQAGLESQYNRSLMGKDGVRRVIVNSRGLEVGEAERVPYEDGPALTLTLDAELQKTTEAVFRGRSGSAVALDPETGEILALTSTPAYDPNRFTTGIEAGLWQKLTTDPETPLMNRVIQGLYAPGSTFKIVAAVAGLEEGVITPRTAVYCPGYYSIYGTVRHCNAKGGHGIVDLRQAIARSCNVYFYQLGVKLEIARLAAWGKKLGLGSPTGVDLPHEASGLMPSPEWKLRVQRLPWYAGETVSVAIGQGQVSVTPLQLARLGAFVANGGPPGAAAPREVGGGRARALAGSGSARPQARHREARSRGHARRGGGGHGPARPGPGRGGGGQDGLGPGGGERAARPRPQEPQAAAPRLVRLLRSRGASPDRHGGAGRARGQRG